MSGVQLKELTADNGWFLLHSFNKVMSNSKNFYVWNDRIKDVVNISMDLIKNRGFVGHIVETQRPTFPERDLERYSKDWAGNLVDHHLVHHDNGVVDLYGRIILSPLGEEELKNPLKGFSIFSAGHAYLVNDNKHIALVEIRRFDITTVRKTPE